jgi:MFS family permease
MVERYVEIRREAGAIFASTLGLSCAISTLGLPYSIGVMVEPLKREFGWTLSEIMDVQIIVAAAVVIMAAAIGHAVDRYGARRIILGSQLGFALGMAALGAFTTSLLLFRVIYGLTALAAGGTIAVTFMKLLTRRFDRDRGLALGIALAGTGLSSMVYQPLLTEVVDRFGWRWGYALIGVLTMTLAWPAAYKWLHDLPANSAVGVEQAQRDSIGHSLAEALRSWRFWILFFVFFMFSGAITGVLNNFVPILTEQGYPRLEAAAIAGTFGIAVVVGRIFIGAMLDRWWAPMVGFAFFVPSALGMALLGQPGFETWLRIAFVALAGLAAGAEVDLMAYLVSRYFGLRAFGKIYGWVYVGFALGPAALVPLFARARDASGDYALSLIGVGGVLLGSAVLLLLLGRYPPQYQAQHLSVERN